MNAHLIEAIGWTLLHFVWQGALLGCATALALTALRNAHPRHRYLVACVGLLACLAWPAAELLLRLRDSGAGAPGVPYADALLRQGALAADAGVLAFLRAQLLWIVAFWGACAVALAIRMACGLVWVKRAASAPPADLIWQQRVGTMARQFGVQRAVRVRVVTDLASPLTAGWWRPVILMPASLMSGMPAELLEALLAHEMAHVRRFDYLVNLGQNVIEILLFYHPAVWWISHRVRVEREMVADDLAATHLGEPRRLAQALSELERWQFSDHHLALAANGGDLMARVRRLLRPDHVALNWKAALPVLGLAGVCLGAYAQTAHANEAEKAKAITTRAVADFSSCAKPVWPASSLAAEHTGTVVLGFQIDASGRAIDSVLKESSGDPLLDEAARTGILKCRFKPATVNGEPVMTWMQMRYMWVLK